MEAAGHFYDRVVADQVAYPRVTAWDTVGWERDREEAVHKAHDSCDRQMLPLCNGSECPVLRSVHSCSSPENVSRHQRCCLILRCLVGYTPVPGLGWGSSSCPRI